MDLSPGSRAVRSPSLRDVAAVAGVSYQTVSRVLNDSPHVRDRTRARVLAAVADLAYTPDLAARALASGTRTTLGIVDLGRHRYGPSLIEEGLRRAASAAGVRSVVSSADGDSRPDLERAFREVVAERVHALVVIGDGELAARVAEEIAPGLPVVHTDALATDAGSHAPAQYVAAYDATHHLISLGHRRIGHISGPGSSTAAGQRRLGWAHALRTAGLRADAVVTGSWSEDTGYRAATTLLAHDDLTALFAANDAMALGALHAAARLGRHVPRDLSVVGFDDVPGARHHVPALTTVRQDFAGIGAAAFAQTRSPAPTTHLPPPRLVLRDSTGQA